MTHFLRKLCTSSIVFVGLPFLVLTLLLVGWRPNAACSSVDAFFGSFAPDSVHQVYLNKIQPSACAVSPSRSGRYKPEDLFYHLGGNGPWVQKQRDVISHNVAAPPGCEVEQVHMMSRHGERYPTRNAGNRHLSLLKRLEAMSGLNPALDFLRNWTYFTSWDNPAFEQLTSTGLYAGTLEAFTTGVKLRTRYHTLLSPQGKTTRFWSASSPRDIATSKYFADGFFGRDWETQKLAELEIIPETAERGANTLTPGDTCLNYVNDQVEGHDKGYGILAEWQNIFTQPIIERLSGPDPDMKLTPLEVYGMMEICGFEMLARDGISPWCNLFTKDEWLRFEYGRDLLHFYRAGPGNGFSKVMGMLWLNATLDLLEKGPDSGTLFFSFVHDGDIIPLLSALGYPWGYDQFDKAKMPSDRIQLDRAYKTTDVTPMGGRIIFERLRCGEPADSEIFIRLNINDGILPVGYEASGPGNSTALSDFKRYLLDRAKLAGNFREVCGLGEHAPERITFLRQ